jgi:hypothetical protein
MMELRRKGGRNNNSYKPKKLLKKGLELIAITQKNIKGNQLQFKNLINLVNKWLEGVHIWRRIP